MNPPQTTPPSSLRRYIADKVREPGTYVVALIVGCLINLYGQILVPFARGNEHPFDAFLAEYIKHPDLVTVSIALGFCFPLVVGVLSAVMTRYRMRSSEEKALFPDLKPDPVFRVDREGRIVDMGSTTRAFFEKHGIDRVEAIIGEELWREIRDEMAKADETQPTGSVRFAERDYVFSVAPAPDETINVYMCMAPAAAR